MNEIYMAGPSITKADSEIVMDAVQNGWYGIQYQFTQAIIWDTL